MPSEQRVRVLQGLDAWELDEDDLVLGRKLGFGATSDVFSGTWKGRKVAVKQLTGQIRAGRKTREGLCRELGILMSVQHENVVQMQGATCFQPVCIITELCTGGSLFDRLHDWVGLDLTWFQRLKVLSDTAAAMCYLHGFEPQIIHRDLKSLNLLLAAPVCLESDVPMIKLSDFGLSRLKMSTERSFMTQDVGTCHWMAPEVLRGGAYDEKIDVYSFAMIVFEVICQRIPFDDIENAAEIIKIVDSGNRPDLAAVPQDCPASLLALMKLCWHHDPSLRPDFVRAQKYLHIVQDDLTKDGEGL